MRQDEVAGEASDEDPKCYQCTEQAKIIGPEGLPWCSACYLHWMDEALAAR